MGAKLQVKSIASLLGHKQAVYTLCTDGAGKLCSAGGDGFVVRWNFPENENGTVLAQIPEPVYTLTWHEGSESFLAGSLSGHLYVVAKGQQPRKIEAHTKGIYVTEMLGNGHFITTGGDGKLILWNANFAKVKEVQVSHAAIRSFAVLKGKNAFVFGSSDWKIYMVSAALEVLGTLNGHEQSVFALAYSEKLNTLFSGGRDAVLRSWNMQTFEENAPIAAHLLHIHCLAFNPDETLLASSSMDKTIKLWNPENRELLKVIDNSKMQAHISSVNKILWMDNETFVSCSDDRKVIVYSLQFTVDSREEFRVKS